MSKKDKPKNKVVIKLKDIRRAKGMSVGALAEKIGVDYQRVGRMERGETQMSINMLQKISHALEVSMFDLVEEDSLSGMREAVGKQLDEASMVHLVPFIYEQMNDWCSKREITLDNQAVVQLSTVIYKSIEEISTKVKDSKEMVRVLLQAFDVLYEKMSDADK